MSARCGVSGGGARYAVRGGVWQGERGQRVVAASEGVEG